MKGKRIATVETAPRPGSTPTKVPKKQPKIKKDLGEEMVQALEEQGEIMRAGFRPFTEEEKARLKKIMQAIPSCLPPPEDDYILSRLLDSVDMLEEMDDMEEMDGQMMLIVLGMAYERVRAEAAKPQLPPKG